MPSVMPGNWQRCLHLVLLRVKRHKVGQQNSSPPPSPPPARAEMAVLLWLSKQTSFHRLESRSFSSGAAEGQRTSCALGFASELCLWPMARVRLGFFFFSVAKSCLTLCDPIDCSTLGLPVHHHLPELAQTHVHWVGDAIQPSHPPSLSSPPAFNLS